MEVVSNAELIEGRPRTSNTGRLRRVRKRMRAEDIPVSHSKPPGRFYDFCRVLWTGVFKCTMRIKASGLEAIQQSEGGVLIAVSHVSHLDPVVVSALLQRRISWVSRIEFYQKWISRTVLYHGGAFRVDRRGAALPTIREGLKRLGRGEAVGIFPEGEVMNGERSVFGETGRLHLGGAIGLPGGAGGGFRDGPTAKSGTVAPRQTGKALDAGRRTSAGGRSRTYEEGSRGVCGDLGSGVREAIRGNAK
jgi:1-acyl-sn-glycerol-3-phosphate acyltransferase